MRISKELMIEGNVSLAVHEDYSQMMHETLQNQISRNELQRMESDMSKSLLRRFEDTNVELDDLMSSTNGGLNEIISMT